MVVIAELPDEIYEPEQSDREQDVYGDCGLSKNRREVSAEVYCPADTEEMKKDDITGIDEAGMR